MSDDAMKSSARGRRTSGVDAEVVSISPHGLWLALADREYQLPFDHFPWFRDATVAQIGHVVVEHGTHLRWPDLDVDLDLESIEHPERFPLMSRVGTAELGDPSRSGKRKRPKRAHDG